ncbi:methane monooxygenase subunit A -verruco12- [Methylacidimicrobium cyclopophantes]|uniref:Methane monooxygenase subunit A -verruco12 n=1 Tax=Methylacidimicrobium cyclopophantes TaxID=1041766 RepID=A0A088MGP2_9BACT|nr:bacterial ammonia monooxygenase, subunit AmoA [Methylacidimicrobium cyclopophantes]AIN39739.1 methane monooxygenase subunit PmoA2 [Methylacidimicrobium cyclopophantes]VVM08467.1 methane monooxygenase subunit A -verruco12- [Methylacidimicrobium cyclopophantes]
MEEIQADAEAKRVTRRFEWFLLVTIALVLMGTYHLHQELFAGDWSFWLDWKDRNWWPIIAPVSAIAYPAATQWLLWTKFRMPFGATLCALLLLLAEWLSRYWNFWDWTHYPLNFVFPETFVPAAVVLDVLLMLTGNWVVTALIGGELWGWLFYPTNWIMIAPYHVPVEYQGALMSVADVISYMYVRTSTPEYLRIVETGTMRSFAGGVTGVAAFFSGFLAAILYAVWWIVGALFGGTKFFKPYAVATEELRKAREKGWDAGRTV